MKKFLTSLVVLAALAVMSANAQINFGVKGGLNYPNMKINYDNLVNKCGSGWFVGPTLKASILPRKGIQDFQSIPSRVAHAERIVAVVNSVNAPFAPARAGRIGRRIIGRKIQKKESFARLHAVV